ncbi:MAG: prepilin-type N-terminal cleavage/methylation domain-containing protein, partial [Planctomycetota bacterium]|nr:prepilin-type N-terminal cleavage/methylation domain-containing protein [Planctomycetota bacterium]
MSTSPARYQHSRRRERGFTITELLVVIVIFVLIIGIAIPAFKSMIESSERALAENQLRVGLSSARNAAIQNASADAAAVFFFQPGGRLSIVPCISVGFLGDKEMNGATATGRTGANREVFVPLSTGTPVQLPKNWLVRAYTPANAVSGSDVDPSTGNANGWYDSLSLSGGPGSDPSATGHWIFPETGFFNPAGANVETKGWQRQTFMVRFKNGTGELDASNRTLCLVIDPIASEEFRTGSPYSQFRIDQASDLASSVRRLLESKTLSVTDQNNRLKVLGDTSIDSVLARPVTELSVYNERSLSAGLASALQYRGSNRVTGTIYADPAQSDGPALDSSLFAAGGADLLSVNDAIGRWIEGRLREGNS